MSDIRDVLVVGAGPAGSALAYFLASNGMDVEFVDKSTFPRNKTCGDGLSPRAIHILKKMGLLEAVREAGFEIRHVAFFAPNGDSITNLIPFYENLPDFAIILPRNVLDDMIRLHAIKAGASFRSGVNVSDVLRRDDHIIGVQANTQNGPVEIKARFTICATGAAYSLLNHANLISHTPDFSLAARTYYEGVRGLSNTLEIHYDSVPLPGYGWVFPTSPTSANIGAGYYVKRNNTPTKNSPRQALDEFTASSRIAEMLSDAHKTAPIAGFPLRFDFPSAKIAFPGLSLVGEACGLVNPLTGEGIDYALESAEIAAEILTNAIRTNESLQKTMDIYSTAFRAKFLPTYNSLIYVQKLYSKPWMMNRYILAAKHNDELALLLLNIGFGNIDPLKAFSLKNMLQLALG